MSQRRTYLVLASLKVAVTRNVEVRARGPMLVPGLKDLKRSVFDPPEGVRNALSQARMIAARDRS